MPPDLLDPPDDVGEELPPPPNDFFIALAIVLPAITSPIASNIPPRLLFKTSNIESKNPPLPFFSPVIVLLVLLRFLIASSSLSSLSAFSLSDSSANIEFCF